jgi:hypothetical protein
MVTPNPYNPYEPRPLGHCTMVIVHGNGTPTVHDLGLMHTLEGVRFAMHCHGGVKAGDRLSVAMTLAEAGRALSSL